MKCRFQNYCLIIQMSLTSVFSAFFITMIWPDKTWSINTFKLLLMISDFFVFLFVISQIIAFLKDNFGERIECKTHYSAMSEKLRVTYAEYKGSPNSSKNESYSCETSENEYRETFNYGKRTMKQHDGYYLMDDLNERAASFTLKNVEGSSEDTRNTRHDSQIDIRGGTFVCR